MQHNHAFVCLFVFVLLLLLSWKPQTSPAAAGARPMFTKKKDSTFDTAIKAGDYIVLQSQEEGEEGYVF